MYEFYNYYILDNFNYTNEQIHFMYKFFSLRIKNFVIEQEDTDKVDRFLQCFATFIKFSKKCFGNSTMRNKINNLIQQIPIRILKNLSIILVKILSAGVKSRVC